MKLLCDRNALLDAINTVSGVVAQRTPREVLRCVHLDADGDTLVLSATDAEISLRLRLERTEVNAPGQALVPADKLRQIVSAEDSDDTLTLETDDEANLIVQGADARFRILGQQPQDFPSVPDQSAADAAKDSFEHPAHAIDALITRTIFAKARDTSRYAINGVLLARKGKKLEFVATDGRRLALARDTLASAGKEDSPSACIIPSKALLTLQKLIAEDPDQSVRVAMTESQIIFLLGGESPHAVLASNLVEGTFPPYEDVIPKDQDKTIVVDRDVLKSAVRRASILTSEDSRGVRFGFNPSEKLLTLESRSPEAGEAQIRVELGEYSGDPIEIGFNPNFIVEVLNVLDDPRVTMELKAPNKPGLIKGDQDFLYVVMPVNLSS